MYLEKYYHRCYMYAVLDLDKYYLNIVIEIYDENKTL